MFWTTYKESENNIKRNTITKKLYKGKKGFDRFFFKLMDLCK